MFCTLYKFILMMARCFIFTAVIGLIFNNIRYHSAELTEECNIIGPEIFSKFDEVEHFSNMFYILNDQLNEATSKQENKSLNMIMLIGNTGAGKSTLAQLISGNKEKLLSVETSPDSGDYIVIDNDKIGMDTVVSTTLIPDLIIDSETGNIVCDSPGFKDTRSPIHELVAASSMVKVLKSSRKIKIVLVIPQTSLMKGSYRDDFTNLLKQTTSFVKDVDKYKKSFYLTATKGNLYTFKKGMIIPASEESVVHGIRFFLNEAILSLENSTPSVNGTDHLREISVIKNLLDDSKSRIKLFRKPSQEGPLIEITEINDERSKLREVLLSDNNFTTIDENDFGYSISDRAKVYLVELFLLVDKYIASLSGLLSRYFVDFYRNKLHNIKRIDERIKELKIINSDINKLVNEIKETDNAKTYINSTQSFIERKNINYKCKMNLNKVDILINFLDNIDNFLNSSEYSYRPDKWSASFSTLTDFVRTETENNYLIEDVFLTLTGYEIQKKKTQLHLPVINDLQNDTVNGINEEKIRSFLTSIDLYKKYNDFKLNENTVKILNSLVDITIKSETKIYSLNDALHVEGYIVRLSEIQDHRIENKNNINSLVILAMHTVFIDKDLDEDYLKGKEILIVAPTWHVVGTRRLSVDGRSGKTPYLSYKADLGEIGKDGANGESGGTFTGVGMTFENGHNLILSANGGDGENGQNGGDGLDGRDGWDGYTYSSDLSRNNKNIYLVYNNFEETSGYKGVSGTPGGDSGAGGKGGKGGKKGTVDLSNVGPYASGIKIEMDNGKHGRDGEDGIPGRGGQGGCDVYYSDTDEYFLFFRVSSVRNKSYGRCRGRSRSGFVKRNRNLIRWHPSYFDIQDKLKISCSILAAYTASYKKYESILFDAKFEEFMDNINKNILRC
ncbi:uncharacterized protein LOC142324434 [Lycorma delicatula]|uniref:uncharacterized protein LOC142324434 n=1 Tax=Lycorma delicatula TaxID=130591 RepID=UPI003F514927